MAKGLPPAPVTVTSAAIGRPLSRMPVDHPVPMRAAGQVWRKMWGGGWNALHNSFKALIFNKIILKFIGIHTSEFLLALILFRAMRCFFNVSIPPRCN